MKARILWLVEGDRDTVFSIHRLLFADDATVFYV